MVECCGSGQNLLSQFHSKCSLFVEMTNLLQEYLVGGKFRSVNILWLAVEIMLKDLAAHSLP